MRLRLPRKGERRAKGRRKRRAAPPGQSAQTSLGLHQGAGGRQDQIRARPAKRDERHLITPGIGLGQQKLDCALGLGQTRQG